MKLLAPVLVVLAASAIGQMPDMAPPKELKNIEFMVGSWKGTETHNMGGPPEKSNTTAVVTKGVGGRFITGTHVMKSKSMTMHGVHMLTYDPLIKKYRAWWFDNMSSEALVMTGNFIGKTLVMTSEAVVIPGMDGKHQFRAAWTPNGPRGLTFLLRTRTEALGSKWETVIDGKYRK